MKDLTVIMEDQPGKLAELGEATGQAGVNIKGLCAMVGDGKGFIHILVENAAAARKALEGAGIGVADEREAVVVDLHDKPGAMGEITRDLAEAGVNIDVAYTIFTGVRLVILTDDVEKARTALDLNGAESRFLSSVYGQPISVSLPAPPLQLSRFLPPLRVSLPA